MGDHPLLFPPFLRNIVCQSVWSFFQFSIINSHFTPNLLSFVQYKYLLFPFWHELVLIYAGHNDRHKISLKPLTPFYGFEKPEETNRPKNKIKQSTTNDTNIFSALSLSLYLSFSTSLFLRSIFYIYIVIIIFIFLLIYCISHSHLIDKIG